MIASEAPDLAALRVLLAVSETGSLTGAGRKLGVSQQAVSSRMRALERNVGTVLAARSHRGASLTSAGVLVAGWAAEVLSAARRLELGIQSIHATSVRHLKVAASLTVAEYLLPHWLVVLRDRQEAAHQNPTQVGLTAANSEAVIALVRSGKVDLGFIETPELPADLKVAAIGSDTMQIAVAPQHPWAVRRDPVSAAELARTPLITREPGSGTRLALEHLLASVLEGNGTLVPPRGEYGSTAAVRTAIASGIAPGVLSSVAIADDLALGRVVAVAIRDVSLTRQLTAVWSGDDRAVAASAGELVSIAIQSLASRAVSTNAVEPPQA
jgi:DNA-binding transcriptional LysR family regulator